VSESDSVLWIELVLELGLGLVINLKDVRDYPLQEGGLGLVLV
jgi:hypothetical protein